MATLGGALALNARRHPEKTALIFGETIYSYAQLAARIDQYAHALAAQGVGKGDRVALLSPNSDAYVLGLYGTFRLGAIAVPLNPRVPARELHYLLEDSGTTVLLYSEDLAPAVAGLAELEPLTADLTSLVLDESAAKGIARIADTMPTTAPEVEVAEDEDCIILYTSGTTGRPKGALFDHHRMLWVGHSITGLGMNVFDRNLHVAPMYHSAELVLFVMNGFTLGTTHVVLPAFEPTAVIDALEKYEITVFLGVPTMYQFLLEDGRLGKVVRVPARMTEKKIYGNTSIACLTVMVNREMTGPFSMPPPRCATARRPWAGRPSSTPRPGSSTRTATTRRSARPERSSTAARPS